MFTLNCYTLPPWRAQVRKLQLVCLLVLTVSEARAQNIAGAIAGEVRDASGASVPVAKVAAVMDDTNYRYEGEAVSGGAFVLPNLPPGVYTLTVEADGFKRAAHRNVAVLANRTARVEVTLELGAVTQSVDVAAALPVVNS